MDTAGTIVVFVIIWWMVLFISLPFGVRRQESPEPGMDHGAPERPRMLLKAGVATIVSVLITTAIWFSADAGWLPLKEWLRPPAPLDTRQFEPS